jgi:hypothetical protein
MLLAAPREDFSYQIIGAASITAWIDLVFNHGDTELTTDAKSDFRLQQTEVSDYH